MTTRQPIPPPEPGAHEDVPMDTYHLWGAANNSTLKEMWHRSPAAAHYKMTHLSEPTSAQIIGTAAHMAVLQPDLFPKRYVCGPDARRNSNDWTSAEAKAAMNGATLLKPKEYDQVIALRDAVFAHDEAMALLDGGFAELSLVWDDEDTGIRCKARMDEFCPDPKIESVIDLKFLKDAGPDAFERALWDYAYFLQGGHYLLGANARGFPARRFTFICVEKEEPIGPDGIGVYRLAESAVEAGIEKRAELMRLYARCMESGKWPGYRREAQDVTLPSWAWAKLDNERSVA